jgi:hypothetical protein
MHTADGVVQDGALQREGAGFTRDCYKPKKALRYRLVCRHDNKEKAWSGVECSGCCIPGDGGSETASGCRAVPHPLPRPTYGAQTVKEMEL